MDFPPCPLLFPEKDIVDAAFTCRSPSPFPLFSLLSLLESPFCSLPSLFAEHATFVDPSKVGLIPLESVVVLWVLFVFFFAGLSFLIGSGGASFLFWTSRCRVLLTRPVSADRHLVVCRASLFRGRPSFPVPPPPLFRFGAFDDCQWSTLRYSRFGDRS